MAVSDVMLRACLLFEFKLGTKTIGACRKARVSFGLGILTERICQEVQKFDRNENLENEPRSGTTTRVSI